MGCLVSILAPNYGLQNEDSGDPHDWADWPWRGYKHMNWLLKETPVRCHASGNPTVGNTHLSLGCSKCRDPQSLVKKPLGKGKDDCHLGYKLRIGSEQPRFLPSLALGQFRGLRLP